MIKETLGTYTELHDDVNMTYVIMNIRDDNNMEESMCMQVFDNIGRNKGSIGFKAGPIINHKGSNIAGHTLMSISMADKKKMAEICKNIPSLAPVKEEKPVVKVKEVK